MAPAQKGAGPKTDPGVKARALAGRFPEKPSIAPAWTIPVDALGFAAPGALYLGMRATMTSLDFLGEDRLLFTFRVPGLLHREPGDTSAETARQIRAVVLAVPSGAVQAQAQWTLHDRERYLWTLKDGRFLVRDRSDLLVGDATLALKPLLKFPGDLLALELDPEQQFLITNSREPLQTAAQTKPDAGMGQAGSSDDDDDDSPPANNVLRIIKRSSGQVMFSSRVRSMVYLATNSEGYVGSLRGKSDHWTLGMNYFSGGTKTLGDLESACVPETEFISDSEVLATTCADNGTDSLFGISTDGLTLWKDVFPEQSVWPIVTVSPNGLRMARENIFVSHPVGSFGPIDGNDIKGQWVRVFDAATGQLALEAPANPILDGGGNVAISPSGRRVALLGANGIEIFELPAPPPLPALTVGPQPTPAGQ